MCLSFTKNFAPVCTIFFINLGWQYVRSHKAAHFSRPEDDRLTVETWSLIKITILPSKAAMVSLEYFIDIILPAALWPWVDSASNRNEYQE